MERSFSLGAGVLKAPIVAVWPSLWPVRRPVWVFALIVAAALGLRLGYVALTPEHTLVHDAREYDEHARSVAVGDGFSERITGKPTAFRPPGYVYLLAGSYRLAGVERSPVEARVPVGRVLGAVLGALGVALVGVLAWQLWGGAAGIVAAALAAVYVPSILVATALMSEQLFVVLMLATLIAVLAWRRTPRWWLVLLAGGLAGLAVLARANGLILLLPLALAVWRRSLWPPAVLVGVALLTVAPWTLRNASELDAFVPVTTQLGSALAGTYNSEARADSMNPASWRSLRRIEEYDHVTDDFATTPEAVMERDMRRVALAFIREHPGYVFEVGYWNTRRLLRRRVVALVDAHRLDDQRHARMGRPRRDLLLGLRGAGAAGHGTRRRRPSSGWSRSRCISASPSSPPRRRAIARRSTRS